LNCLHKITYNEIKFLERNDLSCPGIIDSERYTGIILQLCKAYRKAVE